MEKKKFKRVMANLLLILIALITIPTISKAKDNETAIVKVDDDYIIYINGLEDSPFKFAYTNESSYTKETVLDEENGLNFMDNWLDTNNVNVACLEGDAEIKFDAPIYMWVNTDKDLFSVELNLEGSIAKEEMASTEELTKIIGVDSTATTTTVEDVNGVTTTVTTGQIDITDDEGYDYQYQLIKIDGTETPEATELINLVGTIQNDYSSMSMYDKILTVSKVKELNESVIASADYTNVENMTILQPDDSKEGDQYIVLLQKLDGNDVVANDFQFLTCTEGYENTMGTETNVVKVTSALPVTYDSIILFVVLAVIVVIAIAVFIKIKKMEKNEK